MSTRPRALDCLVASPSLSRAAATLGRRRHPRAISSSTCGVFEARSDQRPISRRCRSSRSSINTDGRRRHRGAVARDHRASGRRTRFLATLAFADTVHPPRSSQSRTIEPREALAASSRFRGGPVPVRSWTKASSSPACDGELSRRDETERSFQQTVELRRRGKPTSFSGRAISSSPRASICPTSVTISDSGITAAGSTTSFSDYTTFLIVAVVAPAKSPTETSRDRAGRR